MQADFLLLDANLTIAEAMKKVELTAGFLSHFIIRRQKGGQVYHYLFPQKAMYETYERFRQNLHANLEDAFNLHEYTSTSTISESKVNTAGSGMYVVLSNIGEATGYLLDDGQKGMYPESPAKEDDTELESYKPTDSGTELESTKNVFEAFPYISDPGPVKPKALFSVDVGFSKEKDSTLQNVQGISIANPDPDDYLKVFIIAEGATVSDNVGRKLFLDINAKLSFHCEADADATEIRLVATFLYKGEFAGTATRVVNAKDPASTTTPAAVALTKPAGNVDLTAIIWSDSQKGQLYWRLNAESLGLELEVTTDIKNTREFADTLISKMDNSEGRAAYNALGSIGQKIAAHVPPAFFTAIKDLYSKHKRIPHILLCTNELYVPWELAVHKDIILDSQIKPFLHLQTVIGRWYINHQINVQAPPTQLPIKQLSVVATDYSNSGAGMELPEAEKEKKFLVSKFKAQAVKPQKKSLLQLTEAKIPGLMLHMGLHGESKSALNEQSIKLEDGDLDAEEIGGIYFAGETPTVTFMFLNACQVGTAGEILGQASGFPGTMLGKGTLGFIAPLWSVVDLQARHFSESFYIDALGAGKPIGEVLLALRRGFDLEKSLTELAYIYYGHPSLKLEKNF